MCCFREREWYLLLPLLLLPLIRGLQDHSQPEVNASTGSNVTLQALKKPLGSYKRLTWLYTIKQKILEYEYNGSVTIYKSSFKDRVKLDSESGALLIYRVCREDEGAYHMRVLYEAEVEYTTTLKVFDPVPQPSIKIEKTEDLTASCHMKLSCKVEAENINYTWYGDSGPLPQNGPEDVLELTITPQNKSTFYTCQVRNLVSNKNDTLYFTPPCSLVKSSGVLWIITRLVVMVPILHAILMT